MKDNLSSVGLLIIGDELLQGRRSDKHLARALTYFTNIGVELEWVYYLGDNFDSLVDHFRFILKRGDVCFSFGGIGATVDDRTRPAISAAEGVNMVRHPEAARLIEHQFGDEAYPNRILMADLPEKAELIPNPFNNIPGFSLSSIHCLPGFPEMAWDMLDWVVQNHYDVSGNMHLSYLSFIVDGARESEMVPLLEQVQNNYPDISISSLPRFLQEGSFQVELGVRGSRDIACKAACFLQNQITGMGFSIKSS